MGSLSTSHCLSVRIDVGYRTKYAIANREIKRRAPSRHPWLTSKGWRRPGTNTTGIALFESSTACEWLGIFKEVAPAIARIALMVNPNTATGRGILYSRAFETAAATLTVEPVTANVGNVRDIKAAIVTFEQHDRSRCPVRVRSRLRRRLEYESASPH
jgi:hypothetical protein